MKIAESGEAGSSKLYTSPRKDKKWSSFAIAAAYIYLLENDCIMLTESSDSFSIHSQLQRALAAQLVSLPLAQSFMP
jgi:hypothetical protein